MARTLAPGDAEALVELYADYEWWDDREVDDVREALRETDVALGVEEDGTLVAAARILTDYRYYANVFDVIVAADRRGDGLGQRLLRAIVDCPELEGVDGLSLLCRRGLVPFYESVGFRPFDPEIEVPEGGREELVRMVLRFDD